MGMVGGDTSMPGIADDAACDARHRALLRADGLAAKTIPADRLLATTDGIDRRVVWLLRSRRVVGHASRLSRIPENYL